MGNPFEWETAAPESQGIKSTRLQAMWQDILAKGTTSLLVVRNDRIVFEGYADGWNRNRAHPTASLAKALVGGMSLMLAVDRGSLSADDPASRYIPQWADHPQKSKITIRHLATHTSGIEDSTVPERERKGKLLERQPGWKGDFWSNDAFVISRDLAPVLAEPGTEFHYSNPGIALLGYAIAGALRASSQPDVLELLRNAIMRPIGAADDEWSISYMKPCWPWDGWDGPRVVDGLNLYGNWGGGAFSPNASARVGRLMMRKGDWEGAQLVSPGVVTQATTHTGVPTGERLIPGDLSWWVNVRTDGSRAWPELPSDTFYGAGAGQQFLLVVPSLGLIMVRNGEGMDEGLTNDEAIHRHLVTPIAEAVAG